MFIQKQTTGNKFDPAYIEKSPELKRKNELSYQKAVRVSEKKSDIKVALLSTAIQTPWPRRTSTRKSRAGAPVRSSRLRRSSASKSRGVECSCARDVNASRVRCYGHPNFPRTSGRTDRSASAAVARVARETHDSTRAGVSAARETFPTATRLGIHNGPASCPPRSAAGRPSHRRRPRDELPMIRARKIAKREPRFASALFPGARRVFRSRRACSP